MNWFYNNIDLFVLTSVYEGCSNAILEAMQYRIPVVAFNNSSLPEIVENKVSGLLAINEDLVDLVNKVELLVKDKEMRSKYGNAGSQISKEKFSMKNSIDQLEVLIN